MSIHGYVADNLSNIKPIFYVYTWLCSWQLISLPKNIVNSSIMQILSGEIKNNVTWIIKLIFVKSIIQTFSSNQ